MQNAQQRDASVEPKINKRHWAARSYAHPDGAWTRQECVSFYVSSSSSFVLNSFHMKMHLDFDCRLHCNIGTSFACSHCVKTHIHCRVTAIQSTIRRLIITYNRHHYYLYNKQSNSITNAPYYRLNSWNRVKGKQKNWIQFYNAGWTEFCIQLLLYNAQVK